MLVVTITNCIKVKMSEMSDPLRRVSIDSNIYGYIFWEWVLRRIFPNNHDFCFLCVHLYAKCAQNLESVLSVRISYLKFDVSMTFFDRIWVCVNLYLALDGVRTLKCMLIYLTDTFTWGPQAIMFINIQRFGGMTAAQRRRAC